MKQEEKDLLLKDLCGRLPYDVKCKIEMWIGCDVCTIYNINSIGYVEIVEDSDTNGVRIEKVKPYLLPMSSMTEEQKKEYRKVCELDTEILSKHPMDENPFPALYNSQDWLNKNHFDYRNLIPMGLAIDATEIKIY